MPEYVDVADLKMLFEIATRLRAITTSMQSRRIMMVHQIVRDAECGCM